MRSRRFSETASSRAWFLSSSFVSWLASTPQDCETRFRRRLSKEWFLKHLVQRSISLRRSTFGHRIVFLLCRVGEDLWLQWWIEFPTRNNHMTWNQILCSVTPDAEEPKN